MENLVYLVALNQIEGFGPITLFKILELFNFDFEAVFRASYFDLTTKGLKPKTAESFCLAKKDLVPEKLFAQLEKEKIEVVTLFDPEYPSLLKEIYAPPLLLYFRGERKNLFELNRKGRKILAVVGSRKISAYGKSAMEKILPPVAECGLTIVSGMAIGADSLAHRLALEAGAITLAVLGSGLAWDYMYPSSNQKLAKDILGHRGIIFSEFPPYVQGLPYNFPKRNRIISGLAEAVLIVEASLKSGALITAKYALEQNREVLAIPGPIESLNSQGTNYLIQSGAKLISSANDLLQVFGLNPAKEENLARIDWQELSFGEQLVLKTLKHQVLQIDKIIELCNLEPAQVNALVLQLELKGLIKGLGGQNFLSLIKY